MRRTSICQTRYSSRSSAIPTHLNDAGAPAHDSCFPPIRVLHAHVPVQSYNSEFLFYWITPTHQLQHLYNSRFAPIRVRSNSSSYSWEFMLADQHLREIQFTFPSLPIRVFHASAPEIQFAFPSNSTFFEFMRSSSRYNLRSLQFQFEFLAQQFQLEIQFAFLCNSNSSSWCQLQLESQCASPSNSRSHQF